MKTIKRVAVLVLILTFFALSTTYADAATGALTRGDVVYWLYNSFVMPDMEFIESFKDTKDSFYDRAADWALNLKYVTGTESGVFSGNTKMTRLELAVMFARFAEIINRRSGESLMTQDLTIYSDADAIPQWAVDSVSIALEYGIIEPEGDYINPDGYVYYKTVETAFAATMAIQNSAIPPLENTFYDQALFQNDTTIIHLGMDMDEFTAATGLALENWWTSSTDNMYVTVMGGRVVELTIHDKSDLYFRETLGIGSKQAEVINMLGEPNATPDLQGTPLGYSYYLFDEKGNTITNTDIYAYVLLINYDQENTIDRISLSTSNPDPNLVDPNRRISSHGLILGKTGGTGNGSFTVNPEHNSCFDITYCGDDKYAILDSSGNVVFEHVGAISCRMLLPDLPGDGVLTIETSGEWTITSVDIRSGNGKSLYSGNGNYVFKNFFLPVYTSKYSNLRFSHYGDGSFIVRQGYWTGIPSVVLSEGSGMKFDVFEIPSLNPMAYIEVISDDCWSFEFIC